MCRSGAIALTADFESWKEHSEIDVRMLSCGNSRTFLPFRLFVNLFWEFGTCMFPINGQNIRTVGLSNFSFFPLKFKTFVIMWKLAASEVSPIIASIYQRRISVASLATCLFTIMEHHLTPGASTRVTNMIYDYSRQNGCLWKGNFSGKSGHMFLCHFGQV